MVRSLLGLSLFFVLCVCASTAFAGGIHDFAGVWTGSGVGVESDQREHWQKNCEYHYEIRLTKTKLIFAQRGVQCKGGFSFESVSPVVLTIHGDELRDGARLAGEITPNYIRAYWNGKDGHGRRIATEYQISKTYDEKYFFAYRLFWEQPSETLTLRMAHGPIRRVNDFEPGP